MSKKLVLTFVIFSFFLDVSRPEGTQLSKCRFKQGKSCDTEQVDTGQRTREQEDNLWLNYANLDERLKSRSRPEMSVPNIGKPAAIFVNSLHQQTQQQQLLEKQKSNSSGNYQRLHDNYYHHTFHKTRSVVELQQQDFSAYESQRWGQSPRHLATIEQTQKSEPVIKNKQDIAGFGAHNGNKGASKTYDMNTGSAHLIRHRSSNPHPNIISPGQDKKTEMLYLGSSGDNYGKLLTESTTIHPFIATRQALDYLTRYDSKPRPRRWPLRLILPEREHNAASEDTAGFSGTGSFAAGHTRDQRIQRRKYRHPRSTINILRGGNMNNTRDEVPRDAHGKAKGRLTFENITKSEDNIVESAVSDNTQRQEAIKMTNENTPDIRRPQNTAGSISLDDDTARQGDRKRKNRRNQQLKKRNKKSRKRNGQRNEMSETNYKTTVARNDIPQTSSVDSVHVLLTKVVFQTLEDEQLVKNTSNDQNKTTELNVSQLLNREGLSVLNPQTGTSDSSQIPEGCLFNQTSKQCVTSERLGQGTLDANDRTDLVTSQTTRKQRQLGASRKKSERNKGKSKRKSKNLNVSIQTENSTDNHMFVSLQPDLSSTFFIPVNSGTTPAETGVKALLENYSKKSTKVSSDNTRQRVSDRSPPTHVPAHTNSGPYIMQVVTSSETWPFSQTVWTDNYRTTDDVSRSKGEYSGVQEMSQSQPMFVQNKAATVNKIITAGNAENIVTTLRNVSFTSSSLTTSMSPPVVSNTPLSSAGFWKTRLRKNHGEIQYGEDHGYKKNSRNSKFNNNNERRASLSEAFQKSDSSATKLPPNKAAAVDKGNEEIPENGPFIGYKTAYDFLSHQKGPKTNTHSEARREANELNRFMGEGMCEIFNKHYVPTRIGGKCE